MEMTIHTQKLSECGKKKNCVSKITAKFLAR